MECEAVQAATLSSIWLVLPVPRISGCPLSPCIESNHPTAVHHGCGGDAPQCRLCYHSHLELPLSCPCNAILLSLSFARHHLSYPSSLPLSPSHLPPFPRVPSPLRPCLRHRDPPHGHDGCQFGAPSLSSRQDILRHEGVQLAAAACERALGEWGGNRADVTHLVAVTVSGVHLPGLDLQLVKALGLGRGTQRVLLQMLGCYAGVTALRVAKDLAESHARRGARVLLVCCELNSIIFQVCFFEGKGMDT